MSKIYCKSVFAVAQKKKKKKAVFSFYHLFHRNMAVNLDQEGLVWQDEH